ncbi:MAG: helix-turn-helix domain-containing protein, partial [Tannerella sp.]|nr:helix-turn-helix domain-containing protein [Tannerella sp.]
MKKSIIFAVKKYMLKMKISETELQKLRKERYNQPHPRVMLKLDVVYLNCLGFSNADVCKITGVCDNTVREYVRQYSAGGIESLKEIKFYQPCSEMK